MAIKTRRYWDTVCVIGFLANQDGRALQCGRALKDCDDGGSEIVISALTVAEVLHLKGIPRPFPREMRDKIRLFFKDPRFIIANVDPFIAERAQDLFWEHDIMPKDAIHVATALTSSAHFLEPLTGRSSEKVVS